MHIEVLQKVLHKIIVLQNIKLLQYVLQYFQSIAISIAKFRKYCNKYCKISKYCNKCCKISKVLQYVAILLEPFLSEDRVQTSFSSCFTNYFLLTIVIYYVTSATKLNMLRHIPYIHFKHYTTWSYTHPCRYTY